MKRIGRTIPPASSPISPKDIINGLRGLIRGQSEIELFRSELKSYFKVEHVFLVSSGKAALTLILRALHKLYPNRNEVIIPAFCCYSVPSAIVRAGLKIKLCDVNPDTLDYNYNELEKIIAEYQLNKPDKSPSSSRPNKANRLLAIVSVHFFGLQSDVRRVRERAAASGAFVVEDAAQVMGSSKKQHKLGTLGDVGFFSTGRGKAISTVEGGIILTDNDKIGRQIAHQNGLLKCYNWFEQLTLIVKSIALYVCERPTFFWIPKSIPFLRVGDTIYNPNFVIRKMSSFQAGLSNKWNKKLNKLNTLRKKAASRWNKVLRRSMISIYTKENGHIYNFIRFPIRVKNSDRWSQLLSISESRGLGIMLTYPDSINNIPALKNEFRGWNYPAAKNLARELLTLPVHAFLASQDIEKIIAVIRYEMKK